MQTIYSHESAFYWIFFVVFFLQTIFIIMLYKSIVNRKATINAIEKRVIKYQTMFQSMQEGFALFEIIFDQKGEPINYYLTDANKAFQSITGFDREKVINKDIFDLLPKIDADKIEKLNKVALTGEPVKGEFYVKSLERYLLANIYKPEQDKLAVMFSDITKRKQAEELVQRQKLSFEALFTNSSDAIVLFNQYHEVVDINEKFTTLFGYDIEEICGREVDSIVASGGKLEEANQLTLDVLNGNDVSMESIRFGADGQPREVSIKGVAIMLNGKIIGGYGIYADISQRKKAEKEILYMNYHDQLTDLYNRRFLKRN